MDMSEDRKECHICENFNKCNENVSYESNYCNAHRKQRCDKNVANIEDDVKKVKRYLENSAYKESKSDFFKNGGWEMVDLEIPQAMANILAERERDKARIKKLEEERQLVGMPVKNKRDGTIGIVLHQWENGSVAVLERINPRVINTHDSWNTLEIITDEVKQSQTESGSIPKQVVNLKIANEEKEAIKYLKLINENINFNEMGYVYANEYIQIVLNMVNEKDEQIDLIIDEFYKKMKISTNCYIQKREGIEQCLNYKNCKDCIKQYFKNKAKENEDDKL